MIILTIAYFIKYPFIIKKYIFNITEQYLFYLSSSNNNVQIKSNNSLVIFENKSLKNPVKKKTDKPLKDSDKNILRKSKKSQTKIEKYVKNNLNGNKNINKKRNIVFWSNNRRNNINSYLSGKITNNSPDSTNHIYKPINNEISSSSNDTIMKYRVSNQLYFNLEKNNNNLNIKEYLQTDLDELEYDDAVKKDKRKFCEYFYEKIKNNQIILDTFYAYDPLRPRPIKIMLFILEIDLFFLVNGLFFNEEYVSEVFNLKEPDKFFSFVPRSIDRFFYTTLVGVIVGYVVDFFFIEEKKLKKLFLREKDNIIVLKYETTLIIKDIQKRNKWFIVLSFFIIFISLYYIFCFNSIYPHMANEWIKSSIMIFFIMQILSALACFLEAIMRFISFRCKSEKVYKISLLFS